MTDGLPSRAEALADLNGVPVSIVTDELIHDSETGVTGVVAVPYGRLAKRRMTW